MVCYKMPKLKVIEVEYAVFELGIERLKIHSLSAIFLPKKMAERRRKSSLHCAEGTTSLKKRSFFFTSSPIPEALLAKSLPASFHYAAASRFSRL